jgi:dihydroorotase
MTLYLTDNLPPEEIVRAKAAGVVACKLYPAGATTNSDAGVTDLRKTYKTLEAMQRAGVVLLVHGEVTDPAIDVFDREAVFIEQQLIPLRRDFPELKIVMEHLTTRRPRITCATPIASWRRRSRRTTCCTTATRCSRRHPAALLLPAGAQARDASRRPGRGATSGSGKFFLGTDSAPHPAQLKEHALGCAAATRRCPRSSCMPSVRAGRCARQAGRLRQFPRRGLLRAAAQPRHADARAPSWTVPETVPFGEAQLKPLRGGETLAWRVLDAGTARK